MLNYNSPVVQAMLQNTPEGNGNFPIQGYYGNQPIISTETIPQTATHNPSMPYPDPKEMLYKQGQNTVYYSPTSFTSIPNHNIVGGTNNPGYVAAFSGYSNPYIGQDSFGGFSYNPALYYPMDDDARERLDIANINGLTYDEQLKNDSEIYKKMSRTVSKVIGRSEEEAKICEETFEPYNKYPKPDKFERKKKPFKFHIIIEDCNGDVIADSSTCPRPSVDPDLGAKNGIYFEEMKRKEELNRDYKNAIQAQMYQSATERKFDKVDFLDFMNNYSGIIINECNEREIQKQRYQRIAQVYNKNKFRQNLIGGQNESNLPQSRIYGSYGVMPDGRPVQPWHDPSVAESFSYEPSTGKYYVTAPNFIQNRLDKAREAFINSIENNN